MWLKAEGFVDMVRGWWMGYVVDGSPSRILAEKLKLLKGDLKRWNKEVFGLLQSQRKVALEIIAEVDARELAGALSDEDTLRRKQAQADYGRVSCMEEISFRQKSRCLWLKEGDRNTNFFHRMANVHRRKNQIGSIKIFQFENQHKILTQNLGIFFIGYITY